MAVLDPVLTLDDLLAFRERRFSVDMHSLSGEVTKTEMIDRLGPRLMGYDSVITRLAPHRAKKHDYRLQSLESEDIKKAREYLMQMEELRICPFCPHNFETNAPKTKMYHDGLYTPAGTQIVSIPNISPFATDHWMTIYAEHLVNVAELTFRDIVNLFVSGHQIAQMYKEKGHVGITDMFNWGKEAGGSIVHPHAQRGAIVDMEEFYDTTPAARSIASSNGYGNGLVEKLMDVVRTDKKELKIFENDQIFAYAVWAPRYLHHIEAIFKNARNILDLNSNELQVAAESMLGFFHGLRIAGATDVNMVLHQSSFTNEPMGFRMYAEIFQRNKHTYGAAEAGKRFIIIHTIPEETAEILREHFRKPLNHQP